MGMRSLDPKGVESSPTLIVVVDEGSSPPVERNLEMPMGTAVAPQGTGPGGTVGSTTLDVGRIAFVISGREPAYDGDCCRLEPFCSDHVTEGATRFYLVRVGGSNEVCSAVHAEGISVQNSWGLGELKGFTRLLLRQMLRNEIEDEKSGDDDSTPTNERNTAGSEGDP